MAKRSLARRQKRAFAVMTNAFVPGNLKHRSLLQSYSQALNKSWILLLLSEFVLVFFPLFFFSLLTQKLKIKSYSLESTAVGMMMPPSLVNLHSPLSDPSLQRDCRGKGVV